SHTHTAQHSLSSQQAAALTHTPTGQMYRLLSPNTQAHTHTHTRTHTHTHTKTATEKEREREDAKSKQTHTNIQYVSLNRKAWMSRAQQSHIFTQYAHTQTHTCTHTHTHAHTHTHQGYLSWQDQIPFG